MIFSVHLLLNQFQFHLPIFRPLQIPDFFLRSRNRKPLLVKKFLNLQNEIQVFPPVESLERSSFMGFDHFKFRLPVAEHMGLEACDPTHLPDPVIEPIVGDRIFIFSAFEKPGQSSSLRPVLCLLQHSPRTTHSGPLDELSWRLRAPLNTWLGLKVKILLEEISMSSPV